MNARRCCVLDKHTGTAVVAVTAAAAYAGIEIAWRGRTHVLMPLTAGAAAAAIHALNRKSGLSNVAVRCVLSGALLTMAELCCGLAVNRALGLEIWDYSDRPLNLMGQVCPLYACAWCALSLPLVALSDAVLRREN